MDVIFKSTSSSVHHKVVTFLPGNFHFIGDELWVLQFIGDIECSIGLGGCKEVAKKRGPHKIESMYNILFKLLFLHV